MFKSEVVPSDNFIIIKNFMKSGQSITDISVAKSRSLYNNSNVISQKNSLRKLSRYSDYIS